MSAFGGCIVWIRRSCPDRRSYLLIVWDSLN